MTEHALLQDLAASYLKKIISGVSDSLTDDFDSSAPFGELGINSFCVLKIIRRLEDDFGTLPKTLLFENFNVDDLARYFADRHEHTLLAKFAGKLESAGSGIHSNGRTSPDVPVQPAAAAAPSGHRAPVPEDGPIRIGEAQACSHRDLREVIEDLRRNFTIEGCVSRGTRKIAPNLFIGGARRGFFNYGRSKNIILVYGYTGPREYFPILVEEMHRYCSEKNFQLNILADESIPPVGGVCFSATPFGVLQRIVGLKDFTIEGGAMRRLRYQVSKFQKSGVCRTEEYRCGSNRQTELDIAGVIDRWCESKGMVNPLVWDVKEEILAGTLRPEHRLFLTYSGDVLQNVILITEMSAQERGYLMDLEFYSPEMPLGGLEFAIVQIIETLKAEGCNVLSMGGTYGCKLAPSPDADPDIDKLLDDLRSQNIFNDEGNLQFKNKFHPENRSIFLCRPVGSGTPDNVLDIIMMIADPQNLQTSEEENYNFPGLRRAGSQTAPPLVTALPRAVREPSVNIPSPGSGAAAAGRMRILQDAGFNPLNISSEHIEFDLKTDSWAQLDMPAIAAQMSRLHSQLQQPTNVHRSLRSLMPFDHFVLAASGQKAEDLFFKAWPKKGVVLQNLLFPSTIFHQIDNGFTPRELPEPGVFALASQEPYKGNIAWDALRAQVREDANAISCVCIELANNAAGGAPVSIRHLRDVKTLLTEHAIPLVLDITRVVENARMLVELESECAGKDIWVVVREILSYADAAIGSLTKDFCVNKGGIIATNDANLSKRLQELVQSEGSGTDLIDEKLVALSLQNRKQIEAKVLRRMEGVRSIAQALSRRNIPIAQPTGGHCILIDVKQLPEFAPFQHPSASFVAWTYLSTGIRCGVHSVGMQRHTSINDLVRFAIPLGMQPEQIDEIIARLCRAFDGKVNIPELAMESAATQALGDVYANYKLIRYHNACEAPGADAKVDTPAAHTSSYAPSSKPQQSFSASGSTATVPGIPQESHSTESVTRPETRRQDIAIVGMAGRFPHARNPAELWENLTSARDCVETIPAERYERLLRYKPIEKYRGGFIDDVDKFDSLFFNISPREAEMLDPQERLFLEVAWEAIEDAGYYPETLTRDGQARKIGVFVGAVWAMYQMMGTDEPGGGRHVPNSFLWSIANRVSYWFNFSGASMTVDTACSSSLTAIYLACEAIYAGECSAAIVGGVNLDLHPAKLEINQGGGALSSDGVCRSFGKGANGYVAGEGVAALLLKPLERAVEDGDHVYGVIKSAVVNHGGRTSGYTVPNPKAQTNLIQAALERANAGAGSLGYIEAHGTGTELGDPIEIAGLSACFETDQVEKQTCAIGSIKSNIGHLEAAAGVAGICKVLLQMKHRQLAPSLHSAELNEHIDFQNSPFYVVQRLEEWRPKEAAGARYPLRAGVSSFGAGGANAHVILESYEPVHTSSGPPAPAPPLIFPFSARSEEQLREMAVRFVRFLEGNRPDLHDAAHTLQIGRKSFDHRLAVVARSADELAERLTCFIDGKKHGDVATGHVKSAEAITRLLNGQEKEEFLRLLSQRRDPNKIAALWAEGLLPDWNGFPAPGAPRRIPLPTYPFAGKRHWVVRQAPAPRSLEAAAVHPMVDSNESTFERQLFKKTFHLRDFFIYDHQVEKIPTLPGVAYLELARKAGEMSARRPVRKIKNIVWVSPIAVQNSIPKEAYIELLPREATVRFEVFSHGEGGSKVLHAQGTLLFASDEQAPEPEYIDLTGIRSRCTKALDAKAAYAMFDSFGLNLGPSFQVLEEIHKNDDEVLGALRLPEFRQAELDSMVLHPSLVDGSLQAGMGSQLGERAGEMFVPFSIGEVEILHPLPAHCYSYVTQVKEDSRKNAGSSQVLRSNVLIVDAAGKILVKIRESIGIPLREVHKKSLPEPEGDGFSTLYYSYEWEKCPLALPATAPHPPASVVLFDMDPTLRDSYRQRLRVAGIQQDRIVLVQPGERFEDLGGQSYRVNPRDKEDFGRLFQNLIESNVPVENVCFAWPDGSGASSDLESIQQRIERGVYAFLFVCQALIAHKLESQVQLLYVYSGRQDDVQPLNDAVRGCVHTLRLEHPKLLSKTIEVRCGDGGGDRILEAVCAELSVRDADGGAVRYDGQERFIKKLRAFDIGEAAAPGSSSGSRLREKGVYLITGGAGGLGLIFAEYLATRYRARVVLTGRSKLAAHLEARLNTLNQCGADVIYVQADVSNCADVENVFQQAKSRFGEIHGIIHAAGVLRDSLIRNKTQAEMEAVLAPKVFGTHYLDEIAKDEPLDFFVTFSSVAAVTGNAGQWDYSYANHFMDAFAARREQLRANGARHGQTLSVNWSLWADGGMKLDEQTELYFRRSLGIKPLSTATGLEAFVQGLHSGRPQFAVLEAIQEKVEVAWGLREKPAAPALAAGTASTQAAARPAQDDAAADLVTWLQNDMSQIVVRLLKLDAADVSLSQILLDLGFDSIGLTTFANAINEKYELELTPVLFFDYPSIGEIAKYLVLQHREQILHAYRNACPSTASRAPQRSPDREPESVVHKGWNAKAFDRASLPAVSGEDVPPKTRFQNMPIAIVGMSGVMPESGDLAEFWENLKSSKDMISVIPPDRWRWEDYYGDPLKEVNKSNSKWGGFMKEVDKFDPLFFGISPREAQMMDPQQRIFLETVWKAIEDSGHKVSDLSGTRTGLFVGVATNDYIDLLNSRHIAIDGYSASGNSHSVLANRVSFLLNLRGPSAPIDTACSSSLVALHRAVESIHSGSSDMAIVGGVQVMLSPAAYISFGMAGMLSRDGKCKTFDKSANGYVRGEGCGAIFLKPLAAAQADGNHIYAVIKATAENHGGRVTTLTAPNSSAQSALLIEAYEKADIDPATVGYIECHGTGTSLGDPIEIQALCNAFSELYKKHGNPPATIAHCGLSSVKTNIGHLETAAGIAGVLRVLLAIQHKQIPANLHLTEVNPYINLSGTPFYIADKLTPWGAPVTQEGSPVPRRAGVSSFGFGGANAHIVLEEYIPPRQKVSAGAQEPQLIVVSAKNEDRLTAYLRNIQAFLEKGEADLAAFAYTLQVGRDEMPERVAVVASSIEDLKHKLGRILQDGDQPEGTYRNSINSSTAKSHMAGAGAAAVHDLIEQKQLPALGALWVCGAKVDWRLLHTTGTPNRLSLPTYPFARERHWIPDSGKPAAETPTRDGRIGAAHLHPLVHRNISTLNEQKFASRFSGQEFYFADHVVDTQKILPGVAYLEMARAAGELSGDAKVRGIRNVTWERPLILAGDAKDVEIVLTPTGGDVAFAIGTGAGDNKTTHCTGRLTFHVDRGPEVLDIAAIIQRCSEKVSSGQELYPFLSSSGLNLGRSFQVVQSIFANPSESLAILTLPEHLKQDAGQFWLHPALMDGSLHTAVGLMLSNGMEMPLSIPYSAGEIQVFHPLKDLYYGYATWAGDGSRGRQKSLKANFHLLDKSGKVLVRIKDFLSREVHRGTPRSKSINGADRPEAAMLQKPAEAGLHSMVPVWRPAKLDPHTRAIPPDSTKVALLAGQPSDLEWVRACYADSQPLPVVTGASVETIAAVLKDHTFDELIWMAPDVAEGSGDDVPILDRQERGVVAVFRMVKALLQSGYANKPLQWTVVLRAAQRITGEEQVQPAHAGIIGLIGSLAKECPRWNLRLLDLESLEAVTARECLSLPWDKQGNALAHRRGEWLRQELETLASPPQSASACRKGGVYVVIGGAGGIGEVWSRFMIERHDARMVWIGRRPYDSGIEEKVNRASKFGKAPLYLSADATDEAALRMAREKILETYGAIHGVVHSAMVLHDRSIHQMDEAAFRAGLSAKIDVSVNLDRVFGDDALDFMLFFSSIVSFFKSPGQANYSAGCTFKDSFAQALQQKRAYRVKTMNWGYWGKVGGASDEFHNRRMEQLGLGSIEPDEGMASLQGLLGSGISQLVLLKTLDPVTAAGGVAAPRAEDASPAAASHNERTTGYVRHVVSGKLSEVLRLDAAAIRNDAPFADYGVDSIIGANLVSGINEALQIELEPVSLFEYSTVGQLTEYIQNRWHEQLTRLTAHGDGTFQPPPAIGEAPAEPTADLARRFARRDRLAERNAVIPVGGEADSGKPGCDPIAIVGMSGRFAESESLEAFWRNLIAGKDLVRKVSRWSPEDCAMAGPQTRPYCSHGSFIDSIDQFDPKFFGISAQEAVCMDPQQRLFLEESWKALEDAGYCGKDVHEKQCGVYVGCGTSNYERLFTGGTPPQAFWGNSNSVVPARIAYYLNLQGPAIAVDTACSSSLVTLHLACQALWSGETEMALAGGVFLQAAPGFFQVANGAGMLSPDGKCYSLDSRANGFVPGEGVGVLVLKRLRDALRDGDHIHGVIAGSGINQDGRSNGLTAPNGRAQERLERSVYDRFQINPETIQVVEAHGTGTLLGDSVEYGAISRAFRAYTNQKQFCALGTVKSNIGHAATAAGVAGVLKLVLALKHRQIPPTLNFQKSNPAIDLAAGPFYVNTEAKEWNVEEGRMRRAATSSFGFSGTNAHLVLEEAPAVECAAVRSPAYLIVLSARTGDQLKQQAMNLLAFVTGTPELRMNDLSYTLFVGRTHFAHRLTCVARDREDLMRLLGQWVETGSASHVDTAEAHEGRVKEHVSLKRFGNSSIEECRTTASADTYVEHLASIADLYLQGYALDFHRLFPPGSRRMPLPAYPFARERYWVDAAEAASDAAAGAYESATPAPDPANRRGGFSSTAEDLRAWIENGLMQLAAEVLAHDANDISPDRVLLDLGFDSMGLATFAKAGSEKYRLEITPVLFFDYPSIRDVAAYLAEERRNEMLGLYRDSAGDTEAGVAARANPPATHTPSVRSQQERSAAPRISKPAVSCQRPLNQPIAIVGISGVMPQSDNLEEFWRHLRDSKDLITLIPPDRWRWEDYYGDPLKEANTSNSKWGGFMREIDKFDPLFFGISPREAEMMDPQQRIFLEHVWKAVEDAGHKVSDLSGTKTGVFVGVAANEYIEVLRHHEVELDGYSVSGNSHSVLANRVSFLLNLRGPSEPVDTACSSSLVALHRAVESIHSGSCDMAIVGGVQVMLSPAAHISFSKAGMLSGDGKCKTFDKGANGYVRGEGAGAMFLKPLSAAEADGNHIYGVIRATAENHGGRVTTMTAPNASAQSALLVEAYEKADIDPATVGYIECHGTGTSLGDPIETQALRKAFLELYKRRNQVPGPLPHCALSSVKTNIGHLETAAGIAGVLKVLLAMQHREIPASLHLEEVNPYINLNGTPFFIAGKLTPWEAPVSEAGSPLPRRAGVSSFGFGGANAHVVLEEYIPPKRNGIERQPEPQLIVLSARNGDRLRAYVRSMQTYLQQTDLDLAEVAYTLQAGRDEMPERVAVVALSRAEAVEKLGEFLNGGDASAGIYRGNARNRQAAAGADKAREESFVRTLIEQKQWAELAEKWVSGTTIDWMLLHHDPLPKRLSLPAYPFARERYWPSGPASPAARRDRALDAAVLHPLVHRNISTLEEQKFASRFTGEEFYFADHRVEGQRVLPGVAYLEMARAAGAFAGSAAVCAVRNVTWEKPLIVRAGSDAAVEISLAPVKNEVRFSVRTVGKEQATVHCTGKLAYSVDAPSPEHVDIAAICERCTDEVMSGEKLYGPFLSETGLDLGRSFQVVQKIYANQGESLAVLKFPEHLKKDADRFWLHPAWMEGSLHTGIGLMKKNGIDTPLSLPFAVGEVRILGPLTDLYYGYATWAAGDSGDDRKNRKIDIQLLDKKGRVLVRIGGFVLRAFHRAAAAAILQATVDSGTQTGAPGETGAELQSVIPVWSPVHLDAGKRVAAGEPAKVLLLGGTQEQLDWVRKGYPATERLPLEALSSVDSIAAALSHCAFDELLWMAPDLTHEPDERRDNGESIVAGQEQGVLAVFRAIKALLKLEFAARPLAWTIITGRTQKVKESDRLRPDHAAIHGLVGTLAAEYPQWQLRLLDLESLTPVSVAECLSLPWDKKAKGLARRQSEWFQQSLARLAPLPTAAPVFRKGGVYVVIGGAGGVGEVWSRFMIEEFQARIVWIGRRACDEAIARKIDALARLGTSPLYISADATKPQDLERARVEILEKYSEIHGVVHSAIVLKDQSLARMDESAFKAALAAKVDISVNMDAVFGADALDFMLFFSSVVSFLRSRGQSNYAAGCTFKDSFAHAVQQKRSYPVRIMNWGYWSSVGVVAGEAHKNLMAQMGIGSIEPQEGMAALQALVNSRVPQMALVKTLSSGGGAALGLSETVAYYPEETSTVLTPAVPAAGAALPATSLEALEAGAPAAEMTELVTELLASTLRSLDASGDGTGSSTGLASAKQPAAYFDRWIASSRRYLQQHGWSSGAGTAGYNVRALDVLWQAWEAKKADWETNPNLRPHLALLEACLRALPGILTGKLRPTDVLFPNSSLQLVEGVYRGNALADYFNTVLGETLASLIEQKVQAEKSRGIRIVEIGAGTGGTTAHLLPLLQPLPVQEYCYTDLSKAFLIHAESRFRPQFQALKTAVFDVSKPVAAQSIASGHYDVAIAANVLHATPNIRETLRNAKAVLKNHGVLLLNEISVWSLFSHVTFGLLEGWWLYEDTAVRLPGSPGLAPEMWREILAEEGFDSIVFPAGSAHQFGQQIIAARSDGRVRQRAVLQVSPDQERRAPSSQPPARPESGYIQRLIVEKLAEALKMAPAMIGVDAPFAEYGVDSILGVNLVRTINETLQIELETTSLFEYSTVNQLAGYIRSNYKVSIAEAADTLPAHSQEPVEKDAAPPERAAALKHRFAEAAPSSAVDERDGAARTTGAEPIAIIGMSGRFAQSESLDEFWRNLKGGKDLVGEVTRWSAADCVISTSDGRPYCSRGSFVESIDRFDPAFFRISPQEASYMDPQQRLFLEECWKALEDAGYAGKSVREKQCGVYVGCVSSHYDTAMLEPPPEAFWGNSDSIIPARIAYYLNLQGPAITVDTACSSSLVTIHLACQGLWAGETEMALAGGVFLQATPGFYQVANRARMLSPRGKCHTFDAAADGFVPGEGVGVVLLKRLRDALRDGDHIHGVIAASGLNQDGSSNGLIAPNGAAQERLERSVYQRFQINPETIQVVEAHGTGTLLGDSIEYGAITRAFREYTGRKQFCAIGTVKTNIGHAATAAGIAGVLKLLLSLQHRQIPASLNFQKSNPAIELASGPFYVNTELKDWDVEDGQARRAAISAFGFSGTNAHLVLQEAPERPQTAAEFPAYLVVLSARTAEQLRQQARNLLSHSRSTPDLPMSALSFTLLAGRTHFNHRFSCVVRSQQELGDLIEQWLETGAANQIYAAELLDGRVREQAALKRFGNHCIQECRNGADTAAHLEYLDTIASLYAQGYALEFDALFSDCRRIPLPSYPFARERYWIGGDQIRKPAAAPLAAAVLHPLLHTNTSTLGEQSYSSTFSGTEAFLEQRHFGSGKRTVLPEAACLEMVRAALEMAASLPETSMLEMKDIIWADPIAIDEPKHVRLALFANDHERIDYEIYTAGPDQILVHCQGSALFQDRVAPAALPIPDLLRQMPRELHPAEIDAAWSRAGGRCAPTQRVFAAVYQGNAELLARLSLPPANTEKDSNGGGPLVNLGAMSAAMQAGAALLTAAGTHACKPLAACGVESLILLRGCTQDMFAWARYAPGSGTAAVPAKIDIDLADAEGTVCAQMRGLSFQMEGAAAELPGPSLWHFAQAGAARPEAPMSVASMRAEDKIELFIRQNVAHQVQRPMEAIPIDLSYFDLGLSSLGIANFILEINRLLDTALSPSVLFEHRDIQSLAAYLAASYRPCIDGIAAVRQAAEPATRAQQQAAHRPPLVPRPRKACAWHRPVRLSPGTAESGRSDADLIGEELLEKLLWRDATPGDGYEQMAF